MCRSSIIINIVIGTIPTPLIALWKVGMRGDLQTEVHPHPGPLPSRERGIFDINTVGSEWLVAS
jgi:hypothetical protein